MFKEDAVPPLRAGPCQLDRLVKLRTISVVSVDLRGGSQWVLNLVALSVRIGQVDEDSASQDDGSESTKKCAIEEGDESLG
jgi:hypothetical protein